MQKHVNLVDLVMSFPTDILLQNLASIQKRTSPIKFANLAEKSENGSISNLSTKIRTESFASRRSSSSTSAAKSAGVTFIHSRCCPATPRTSASARRSSEAGTESRGETGAMEAMQEGEPGLFKNLFLTRRGGG